MAIWLNVLRREGPACEAFVLRALTYKDKDAVAAKRMTKNHGHPGRRSTYIIEAMIEADVVHELNDFFEAAFELGRAYGVKHGPAPRKSRTRLTKKNIRQ
jgi:hypothetical protein